MEWGRGEDDGVKVRRRWPSGVARPELPREPGQGGWARPRAGVRRSSSVLPKASPRLRKRRRRRRRPPGQAPRATPAAARSCPPDRSPGRPGRAPPPAPTPPPPPRARNFSAAGPPNNGPAPQGGGTDRAAGLQRAGREGATDRARSIPGRRARSPERGPSRGGAEAGGADSRGEPRSSGREGGSCLPEARQNRGSSDSPAPRRGTPRGGDETRAAGRAGAVPELPTWGDSRGPSSGRPRGSLRWRGLQAGGPALVPPKVPPSRRPSLRKSARAGAGAAAQVVSPERPRLTLTRPPEFGGARRWVAPPACQEPPTGHPSLSGVPPIPPAHLDSLLPKTP